MVKACLATQCLYKRGQVQGYGRSSTIDGLPGLLLLVCQAEGTWVDGVLQPDSLASSPSPRTPQTPQPGMEPEPTATVPLRRGNGAYLELPSKPATTRGRRVGQCLLVGGALCLQSWVGGGTWPGGASYGLVYPCRWQYYMLFVYVSVWHAQVWRCDPELALIPSPH